MKKILLIVLFTFSGVFCDDFSTFLKEAVQNSAPLKRAKIDIKRVVQNSSIKTRLNNPNIDASLSKFDDEDGFSIGFSQEVPFFSTTDDLKLLADAQIKEAKIRYELLYASFVKDLSLSFSKFQQAKRLYIFCKKEVSLSKKIYDISKERFENGTIPKATLLQTKLSYNQALQEQNSLKLSYKSAYYDLLLSSNISKELDLKSDHRFSIIKSQSQNPAIKLLSIKKELAKIRSKSETKSVKSFSFFADYEKEVREDIYRVGISMPLAIFDQKKQEKKIARYEQNISDISLSFANDLQDLKKKKLSYQKTLLKKMLKKNQLLLKEQKELLNMLEVGYKEAKTGLEKLLLIKNNLIKTQKNRVLLLTKLDNITIVQNYISGAYHE